jgi:hypothetical protein
MRTILVALTALVIAAVTVISAYGSSGRATSTHLVGTFPNQDTNANGGYLLYSNGRVVAIGGAPYYGNGLSANVNNFVALVTDTLNPGYWLITSTGKVVSAGSLCRANGYGSALQGRPVGGTVVGAVNPTGSGDEGFDEVNSAGVTSEIQCS